MDKIKAKIVMPRVSANITDMQSVTVNLGKVMVGSELIEQYNGEYNINPSFDIQTLYTSGKSMKDDVTIGAIEVQRVSNEYGKTVYIGGVING